MLDDALPLSKRLAKPKSAKNRMTAIVENVAASKFSPSSLTKDIFGSESDEYLKIDSPASSASYQRADSDGADVQQAVTDLATPESDDEAYPPILSITPFPSLHPIMRVPFTDCNDFRERESGFKLRLEEFKVFLSQTDHIKGSCWNRTEPITLSQKNMLQECVHSEGTYCTVFTMLNLNEKYPRHHIGWDTVSEFQYACTEC